MGVALEQKPEQLSGKYFPEAHAAMIRETSFGDDYRFIAESQHELVAANAPSAKGPTQNNGPK